MHYSVNYGTFEKKLANKKIAYRMAHQEKGQVNLGHYVELDQRRQEAEHKSVLVLPPAVVHRDVENWREISQVLLDFIK